VTFFLRFCFVPFALFLRLFLSLCLCGEIVSVLPFAVADFADDSEDSVVGLIFQGADKVGE
jgi:hypothetical protein